MTRPAPHLYLITDRKACGGIPALLDIAGRVADALPPGSLAVQVREKDLPPRDVIALARALVARLAAHGAPVLVNERFDLAIAAGAAGVHLSTFGMPPADVRGAYDGLVAVSTHSPAELAALCPGDADFAVFGPVFDTPSKRPYGPPVGIDALRRAVAASPIPVVALGGIRTGNAGLLAGTGAAGIATISAVLGAPDPVQAARVLLEAAERCG